MNDNRIGIVIRTLRIKIGLTQQQLANEIGVTDKAVSKWERGIGLPDISTINHLANVLHIDVDNLLDGNIAYLEKKWIGELRLDHFKTKISVMTTIYGKPLVYFFLSYFALAGINDIYVYCSDEEKKGIEKSIGTGEKFGFNIIYNKNNNVKQKMIIDGPIFLYGINLTKYFQRGMSHNCGKTHLVIPDMGEKESLIYLDGKNQVSDLSVHPQAYKNIPIVFENECIGVEREPLGNGMIAIEIVDDNDVLAISNLLFILSKYLGKQIYCLEEIAYRRGLISLEQLKKNGNKDTYILKIIKNEET